MRQEQEIDLVRKAKEGDTAAFALMIRRYQNLVYATAFQILKDTALAEDVAQEAFVTAFRSLPDLRTESSSLPGCGRSQGTSLWRRARNSAVSGRSKRRESSNPLRRMPDRRPGRSGAKPTRLGKRSGGSYPRCPKRSGFP